MNLFVNWKVLIAVVRSDDAQYTFVLAEEVVIH